MVATVVMEGQANAVLREALRRSPRWWLRLCGRRSRAVVARRLKSRPAAARAVEEPSLCRSRAELWLPGRRRILRLPGRAELRLLERSAVSSSCSVASATRVAAASRAASPPARVRLRCPCRELLVALPPKPLRPTPRPRRLRKPPPPNGEADESLLDSDSLTVDRSRDVRLAARLQPVVSASHARRLSG